MWVAAPLAQECADGYSGNGGYFDLFRGGLELAE
jgi:hypothetical protein